MEDDGNLVIHDGDNNSVWESGTSGFDGAVAVVIAGGALVIELAGGSPPIWQNGQLTGFVGASDASKRASSKNPGHQAPSAKHSGKRGEHRGAPSQPVQQTVNRSHGEHERKPSHGKREEKPSHEKHEEKPVDPIKK